MRLAAASWEGRAAVSAGPRPDRRPPSPSRRRPGQSPGAGRIAAVRGDLGAVAQVGRLSQQGVDRGGVDQVGDGVVIGLGGVDRGGRALDGGRRVVAGLLVRLFGVALGAADARLRRGVVGGVRGGVVLGQGAVEAARRSDRRRGGRRRRYRRQRGAGSTGRARSWIHPSDWLPMQTLRPVQPCDPHRGHRAGWTSAVPRTVRSTVLPRVVVRSAPSGGGTGAGNRDRDGDRPAVPGRPGGSQRGRRSGRPQLAPAAAVTG